MAAKGGSNPTSLIELLFEKPYRFEFFQAVRLLEQLDPTRPSVGEPAKGWGRDAVRFRSDASLGFPPSDISQLQLGETSSDPPEMTVTFLGVASPSSFGSLPLHYSEWILEEDARSRLLPQKTEDGQANAGGGVARRQRPGRPLRDFLDLFNHRLVALFYRAWEKYRFAIVYERTAEPGDALFERALASIMGFGTPGLSGRLPFEDRTLLAWCGAVAAAPVPAAVLEDLVASYFGVPAVAEQFIPRWFATGEEEWSRLGEQGSRLGLDVFVGSKIPISQSGFRLRLGPLTWIEYEDFLPLGKGFRASVAMVRLLTGYGFDFDLQLVLKAEEVPELRLNTMEHGSSHRLGWSTWLRSKVLTRDVCDAIVGPEAR